MFLEFMYFYMQIKRQVVDIATVSLLISNHIVIRVISDYWHLRTVLDFWKHVVSNVTYFRQLSILNYGMLCIEQTDASYE